MAVGTNGKRITRDDLTAAFREVVGEGEATTRSVLPQAAVAVGIGALVVIIFAYLAGRRSGKTRSAVVEIRRL
jgi:hypothetical protein